MEFKIKNINNTDFYVQVEMDGYKPLGINVYNINTGKQIDFDNLDDNDQLDILDMIDMEYLNQMEEE